MSESWMVPYWEHFIIRELLETGCTEIVFIVSDGKEHPLHKSPKGQTSLFFRIHQKLDQLIFLGNNNALIKKDLHSFVTNAVQNQADSAGNQGFGTLNPDDLSEPGKYDPDIIFKLDYGRCPDDILRLPRYGVWSFSMKNFDYESEDTTGYYEVLGREPVTMVELISFNGMTGRKSTLIRIVESTCSYSISLNRDKLIRRASLAVSGIVRGTCLYGSEYLRKLEGKSDREGLEPKELKPVPVFPHSVLNIAVSAMRLIEKLLKKLIYTDAFNWRLLFRISKENDFMTNAYGSFKSLKPSDDKFWADPFVVAKKDRYFIFVEEFVYKKDKGHISVLELDYFGNLLKVSKILERSYHMSYPFVFESNGIYFMIPETGGNRSVELYRCDEFPGKWVFVKNLMTDINAVDTTLFLHNGKWWLFTVIDRINSALGASPELFLYYNDDLLSDNWIGHRLNPVITDVRSARPAGRIFRKEDKLYRPSQDCSGRYGNSFDINQIIALSEFDYKEEKVIKVKPDWDKKLKGVHTFNSDGDFTIIDAYSFRRRLV